MAGIYVHVPFCSQACHYCDFHFSTSLKNVQDVIDCIKKELILQKDYLKGNTVNTIYFGGGTPSLIEPEFIFDIINVIKHNFNLEKEIECTIEVNPEDVSLNKLYNWHKCGVNRISIGIQSFIEEDLRFMNRSHTKKQSIDALDLITQSNIKNVNADLIYGYPQLNLKNWKKNLKKLIEFKIQHISCYCLTVEKKTALFNFILNKKCKPLDPEQGVQHFLLAREILIESGYHHYEISNFAFDNQQSLHNKNYWNKTHYLGVGPSAHSYNGLSRQWNVKNNAIYCNKIKRNESFYEIENLTHKNIINEYILTSLRTFKGLDLNFLSGSISDIEYVQFLNEVRQLEKSGFFIRKDNVLHLNEKGILFADSISSQLFLI
tara:strand:+ start:174 stop:1301 length:1128 start_codon:yes stop_codon:yes gene_type:complete